MLLRTRLRPRAFRLAAYRPTRFNSEIPFLRIQDGTFYKKYPTAEDSSNPPLFPNLNFTLPGIQLDGAVKAAPPQHWAIIGPSGRTDLLHILRGQHICIPPNARSYPYLLTDEIADKDPRLRVVENAVQYVGFSGEGSGAIGGTRGAYLSARYESYREETDWTVLQYLRGQTSLNPIEGDEQGTLHDENLLQQTISGFDLRNILDLPVSSLSNGQTRRARIAKAVLSKPELLLLDEPFMGLDPVAVKKISGILHELAKRQAPRLVMALRPQDKVPDWITHIMVVGNSNKVLLQGPRAAIDDTLNVWSYVANKSKQNRNSLPEQQRQILKKCEADLKAGVLDTELLGDLVAHTKPIKSLEIYASLGGEPVIDMEGVRVQYGDKVILGDWQQKVKDEMKDGLHWRVRRGQRWAILGPNGSGKTTLLSMITSDHPQAYGQPVKLFGRSRLPEPGRPGISIFELQSRIGHSSPEIHAFFPRQLSIRQALETAFAETFLSKPKLNIERDLDISAILQYFRPQLDPSYTASKVPNNISTPSLPLPSLTKQTHVKLDKYALLDDIVGYADEILFGELTTAQQRIVLFMRALVAKPDIVILDEAFSGLSAAQRNMCLHFLDKGEKATVRTANVSRTEVDLRFTGLTEDQALIMTSHVAEEIPDSVRYYMRLPSPAGTTNPLDFRFGILQSKNSLRHPHTWEAAWSPPDVFLEHARRTWRRKQHTLPVQDISEFEWWSI
ncbi:hypothetical protein E8E15_003813 [Penicillium rubens]|uniref:Pc21g07870 protein n=2 Tax=Penicillium chrysogenum species complex TaxID=254878 RepID=B6HL81_PENRW|nr:uncharacterized protein N7525_007252 [Penicillium rubens]KZN88524.1 putative ABC transporter ATP-binding protein [Penicillium chrysogenum]CAP95684.1 Pc21g07870 [Penicillium rubens Wisconsin 54-1255]KAF3027987.1 hypothetical protein E8E15_003813 [Penicillium rubens]KAJ5049359.1 hypothetical protein NUH16_007877 [Penicillium rubens]KAJ5828999.1 hypothetical protein N7525_007252 [Penicillium rubens]